MDRRESDAHPSAILQGQAAPFSDAPPLYFRQPLPLYQLIILDFHRPIPYRGLDFDHVDSAIHSLLGSSILQSGTIFTPGLGLDLNRLSTAYHVVCYEGLADRYPCDGPPGQSPG